MYKEPYQISLEEFISANAKENLKETGCSSTRAAEMLLKSKYISNIIGAIQDNKDGVHIEGIEMIRFRTEYMDMVKRYCREKKIILD